MAKLTIRERLAEKIEKLLGDGSRCYPEDLKRNWGANRFNDRCSWHCQAYKPDGYPIQLSSWDSMGDLVRGGELTFIGNPTEIGPIEISCKSS